MVDTKKTTEVFTNFLNGRRYYFSKKNSETNRFKTYICREQTCEKVAKKDEYCLEHQYIAVEVEIINQEKIKGQIIEFMEKGGNKYKRGKGAVRWKILCKFNECIDVNTNEGFCSKHQKDENIENKSKVLGKSHQKKKTILVNDNNGRKYFLGAIGKKIYVCREKGCKNQGVLEEYCHSHKHLAQEIEISDSKEDKNIQYTIKDGIRHKRDKDAINMAWHPLCKFDNDTCTENVYLEGYCKKHRRVVNKDIIVSPNHADIDKRRNNNKTGDATEEYCKKDIASIEGIEDVIRIGCFGDMTDIKYKFKDEEEYRSVQVKTLVVQKSGTDVYSTSGLNQYGEGLLIVGYSKDRTKFLLMMSHDFKVKGSLKLSFSSTRSKYKEYMFTDKDLFLEKLEEMLRLSRKYVQVLSERCLKEYNSLKRLEKKCKKKDLSFELSTASGSIYDCIINGYKIQCKSTSGKDCHLYRVSLQKYGGVINQKQTSKPYSDEDDIDFVIMEILDIENSFYIIPKSILVEKGIFSSENNEGVKALSLPVKGYEGKSKYKWVLDYLNDWSLIKK